MVGIVSLEEGHNVVNELKILESSLRCFVLQDADEENVDAPGDLIQ